MHARTAHSWLTHPAPLRSAHADCSDTQGFIRRLRPACEDAILVHGAETEMSRLSEVLVEEFNGEGMHVYTPRNEESVVLTYEARRSAKVVGSLVRVRSGAQRVSVSGGDGCAANAKRCMCRPSAPCETGHRWAASSSPATFSAW